MQVIIIVNSAKKQYNLFISSDVVNMSSSADSAAKSLAQRTPREIRVETFASKLESPKDDWGLLPPDKGERIGSVLDCTETESEEEIGFFSGNPFVEVTKGIIHLYKEDSLRSEIYYLWFNEDILLLVFFF